jgi:hypothetical protein
MKGDEQRLLLHEVEQQTVAGRALADHAKSTTLGFVLSLTAHAAGGAVCLANFCQMIKVSPSLPLPMVGPSAGLGKDAIAESGRPFWTGGSS